jgi:hypothetical protein
MLLLLLPRLLDEHRERAYACHGGRRESRSRSILVARAGNSSAKRTQCRCSHPPGVMLVEVKCSSGDRSTPPLSAAPDAREAPPSACAGQGRNLGESQDHQMPSSGQTETVHVPVEAVAA